jgi:Predicted periplasmic lipoprotein (DUF2279)
MAHFPVRVEWSLENRQTFALILIGPLLSAGAGAVRLITASILVGLLHCMPTGNARGETAMPRSQYWTIAASAPLISADHSSVAANADRELEKARQAQLRRRTAAAITTGAIGLATYGYSKWWSDGFTRDFRTVNEGWFGSGTESGGTDKLGHGFSNYVGTRLLTWSFAAMGHDRDVAARLGFATSVVAFTAVEVVDGFSRQWRFSPEDALINVAGAGFGYLVERHPSLDQLIDFRLLYRTSKGAQWDPLGDYSGQTYLFTLKATGMPSIRDQHLLRYLELAIGYRARGFASVNGSPGERTRDMYYGISLNIAEILRDTVFRDRPGNRLQRVTDGTLEFVQIPGTAAFARHRF